MYVNFYYKEGGGGGGGGGRHSVPKWGGGPCTGGQDETGTGG